MSATRDAVIGGGALLLGLAVGRVTAPAAKPAAKSATPVPSPNPTPPQIPVPTPEPLPGVDSSAQPTRPPAVPPPAPLEMTQRFGLGDVERLPGLDELVASSDCATILIGPLWWDRAGAVALYLLKSGINDTARLRDAILEQLCPSCAYANGTGIDRLRKAVGNRVRDLIKSQPPPSATPQAPQNPIVQS